MLALLKKMVGIKTADKEEHVSEKIFGSVQKFRVGSTVEIGAVVTALFPEDTVVAKQFDDHSAMVIETVLSFEFNGTKVYRLYCENPRCMVQLQEEKGQLSAMLFFLTQDEHFTTDGELNEWVEFMAQDAITGDDTTHKKVFGPLEYVETLEADAYPDSTVQDQISKQMALFDRDVDEEGEHVEYMLVDLNRTEWCLEIFMGINIPAQDIKIF